MDLKVLKWQRLRGSLLKRLMLRAFAFGFAMLVFSILQMAREASTIEPLLLNVDECPSSFGSNSQHNESEFANPLSFIRYYLVKGLGLHSRDSQVLAKNVFEELMGKDLLHPNSKTLCVGDSSASALAYLREMGFSHAVGVGSRPTFSLLKRKFVCELDFEDASFDFVFSRALDRVPVPALLVLEIERVLRPGGTGAMLVGARDFHTGSLIRSATPISLFLKSSDIIYVCGVGSDALVIFKKRVENVAYLEGVQLPSECPTVINNKPFMEFIEPLVEKKSLLTAREVSYLPKYVDISSKNRIIYVNIGAGESTSLNVSQLFEPYNAIHPRAFSVFLIDHNISALSSHMKDPGISFIYHPDLGEEEDVTEEIDPDEYVMAPLDEGRFNFIDWFKNTVEDDDFVVLRIDARTVRLNILLELFQSGVICQIDELFLHCPEKEECSRGDCGDCMNLFKSLRNSGVFVHQWFGD